MPNNFRWGVIAPGRIANAFAEGVTVAENTSIFAVASTSKTRGQSFADKYGITTVYQNYSDLISDPAIDAIYIANPHSFHFECAKSCLESGKSVLCEKPLTVTAHQTELLIKIARQHNCFLMEALWTRFLPVWTQVRNWISDKSIGDIKFVTSSFGSSIERNESGRLLNPELAGGCLLDMGIYCVSLTQFIFQRLPDSVSADVYIGPTGVDERVSATLRYGDAASQFTCNFLVETENDFRIYGNQGTIIVEAPFWGATSARLIYADKTEEKICFPHMASGFEYQINAFISAVSQGKLQSDENPWQDTLMNLNVIENILVGNK